MSEQVTQKSLSTGIVIKFFIRIAIYIGIVATVLFISAGTINWGMGWVYIGVWFFAVLIGMPIVFAAGDGLIEERANPGENAKSWDKLYVFFIAVIGPILVVIFAGLDHRFGWTKNFPSTLQLLAVIPWLLAYILVVWAMRTNRFFSSLVRIQEDRGHHVISEGPYRFVRHPGYTSGTISALLIPLILGSVWAYLPTVLIIAVYIIRTRREDRTLQNELPGYADYTKQVPYRLVPGLW